MVVVISILAVLAGVLLVRGSDAASEGKETATRLSLSALRETIDAFRSDLGRSPAKIGDLFENPLAVGDPQRDRWHGPYLARWTGIYEIEDSDGDEDSGTNFTSDYGTGDGKTGNPAALDAWGKPIVLQVRSTTHPDGRVEDYSRVVSAGPDGILQTRLSQLDPDVTNLDPSSDSNPGGVYDDVVLYLFRANGPR